MTLGYETLNKLLLVKAKKIKANCCEPPPYETLMLERSPIISRLIKIDRLQRLNVAEIAIAKLT